MGKSHAAELRHRVIQRVRFGGPSVDYSIAGFDTLSGVFPWIPLD